MSQDNRRRAQRHDADLPGRLRLGGGRLVPVRIRNIGTLGALCEIYDLEEPVLEGERAVLEHPALEGEGTPPETAEAEGAESSSAETAGAVVRVELELVTDGVVRHVAVHFDGGAEPTP